MRVSLPRWNWTFAPIAAMVMAGVLLAISVGIAIFAERSYVRQELEETGAQAGILAASVAPALAFQDDETARDYVNAMAANPTTQMPILRGMFRRLRQSGQSCRGLHKKRK